MEKQQHLYPSNGTQTSNKTFLRYNKPENQLHSNSIAVINTVFAFTCFVSTTRYIKFHKKSNISRIYFSHFQWRKFVLESEKNKVEIWWITLNRRTGKILIYRKLNGNITHKHFEGIYCVDFSYIKIFLLSVHYVCIGDINQSLTAIRLLSIDAL